MTSHVLVVDDEKNIRRTLTMILESVGYRVSTAESGEEGVATARADPPSVVLLDVGLPGQSGLDTLTDLRAFGEPPNVIMISGQATVQTAVEATRLGAFDFLEKPLSKDRVLIALRNALDNRTLDREVERFRETESRRHAMVGEGEWLESLREEIRKVGPTPATVLILGESGTGKELVARAVHEASPRADKPFIKVNCAAIPEELIESELFGAVKGAFTGADRTRDGKFLLADGGTLFLDEIGDMNLKAQAKVLRALQEGEIERVGDSTVHRVDVRVLAATNKKLLDEVNEGRFREDLYFRLAVIPLEIRPLRERREDIPRLARHFLSLYAAENGLPERRLSDGALEQLRSMRWRGNIRELRNVVERLVILSNGPEIGRDDVARLAPSSPDAPSAGASGAPAVSLDDIRAAGGLVEARRAFERRCIEIALDAAGRNVSEAARQLGIERSNLHKKMQALGLDPRAAHDDGDT